MDPSPPCPRFVILRVHGKSLAAKDKWLTEEASSDPSIRFLAAEPDAAHAAVAHSNENFAGDGMSELFRTEVVTKNLSPDYYTLVFDIDVLKSKVQDKTVVAAAFDYDWASDEDLIGVAKDLDLLAPGQRTYGLYKRGEPAGNLVLDVAFAWAGHKGSHFDDNN